MMFTSARESRMRLAKQAWAVALAFATLVAGMAAYAGDTLDRQVSFNIAPAALAAALVQYSLQSGVQVAVADSDVANLHSDGLTGSYAAHDALAQLLRGSGLEFSRVGESTVAIRSAAAAPAVAMSVLPAPVKKLAFPDVAVIAPRPPTAQELAGDSLYEFIEHHATTQFAKSQGVVGGLARWRGGRPETLCPVTLGLDPAYNAFVTARVRAIAEAVGAPVQPDSHCQDNVRIVFTTDPEKTMAAVLKRAGETLHISYPHQTEKQLAVSGEHAVQGWYMTSGGGQSILNKDATLLGHVSLRALWPYAIPSGLHGVGSLNGIVGVIMVVNTAQVAGYTAGSIADYIAMATLSVVQSPDHCDPLPSILDLMAPSCSNREKPTGITAGDMAFLKALYFHNTGIGPSLSRDDIQSNMMRQFKGP
jgi:secretin/TonB-like protein